MSAGKRLPFVDRRPILGRRRTIPAHREMTLCIAARMFDNATKTGAIITVSDTNLSSATTALDLGSVKVERLIGAEAWSSWLCMYSGDPTTHTKLLHYIRTSLDAATRWSHADVMTILEDAYTAVVDREVERRISPRQFGIASLADLSTPQYAGHNTLISTLMDLEIKTRETVLNELCVDPTNLLVCGFDGNNEPHIISTDAVGNCTSHDAYAFHAIGINADSAMAWLRAHNDFRYTGKFLETVYRLCEAKFVAEDDKYIGKATVACVWTSGGTVSLAVIHDPAIPSQSQAVRIAFEASRWQKIAQPALDEIERQLKANQVTPPTTPPTFQA